MSVWRMQIRDAALRRVAEVDDYTAASFVMRFRRTGSWLVSVPWGSGAALALMQPGAGLILDLDGESKLSGPVGRLERTWSGSADLLVASGPDDLVWLERRLAYPEAPSLTTATDAYDVRTGVASTVIRAYVNANAGPGAHSTRRVAGLTLGTNPGVGSTVTGSGRFQRLSELADSLALAGGDIGYRLVQNGDGLVFEVWAPADLSTSVLYSAELGNLLDFTYASEAPSANFVIVGGAGEGVARTFVTGGDSTSIADNGRIESFVDARDADNTDELGQRRDEALAEGASKRSLAATPVATTPLTFGSNYDLGDTVSVIVDGTPVAEAVREVHVALDTNGATVVPVIGTPGESDPRLPRLFATAARQGRRITDLERRL